MIWMSVAKERGDVQTETWTTLWVVIKNIF